MVVRPLMVQGTSLQLEGVLKALGSPKAVPLVRSHGVLKADLMALMLIHLTRAGLVRKRETARYYPGLLRKGNAVNCPLVLTGPSCCFCS